MTTIDAPAIPSAEELVGRLLESTIGAMDVYSVYLGERLGYYKALYEDGPATSVELARRTNTAERYAREWLEQQATTGDPHRRGRLRRGGRTPLRSAGGLRGSARQPGVRDVRRTGGAVHRALPSAVGAASSRRTGTAAASRGVSLGRTPAHHKQTSTVRSSSTASVSGYLSQIAGLPERLKAPGAKITEIGFGGGWASIAMARAFPQAAVEGYEIDLPSVEMARKNAASAGMANR